MVLHYTSIEGHLAMMRWYDAALKSLPIPYDAHLINTRYGETHVLTTGSPDALPLVLVHGINVNALNWKTQMIRLAGDYRIILPDVVGFAGKSGSQRLPYYNDAYADWLHDVLCALDVQRAVLAGSSGGGYFVLKFAAVYPENTAGVILVNPCGLTRFRQPFDLFRRQWVADLVGMFGRWFMASPSGARWMVRKSASPDAELNPENIEMAYLLVKYFKRSAPPGILSDAQLQQITAPVLLLLGEHDPYFDVNQVICAATNKLIHADLTTVVVPNAGHDVHNDQAAIVSEHIHKMMCVLSSAYSTRTGVPAGGGSK